MSRREWKYFAGMCLTSPVAVIVGELVFGAFHHGLLAVAVLTVMLLLNNQLWLRAATRRLEREIYAVDRRKAVQ
jgi:hypothetical protein